MVPALEGQRADGLALGGRHLVGTDHPGRVAGAGGGDRAVVGALEGVAEGDDRRSRADRGGG